MCSTLFAEIKSFVLIVVLGVFSCTSCYAERGGDVRGYSNGAHGNDNNFNNGNYYRGDDYHGSNWGVPAVVIGVPGSNAPTCSTVQQCDSDGNCTQSQVCD